MVAGMGKSKRMICEVEEILTVKLKQIHPAIERIGIAHGPAGWRCYRLWSGKAKAVPSPDQMDELLGEANTMLLELQKHFEIVK